MPFFDYKNKKTDYQEKAKKQDQSARPLLGHERLDNLFAPAQKEEPKTDYQARPQSAPSFAQPKQDDPFATRIQPREDNDIPPFLRKLRK